jgi:hypothetical protein
MLIKSINQVTVRWYLYSSMISIIFFEGHMINAYRPSSTSMFFHPCPYPFCKIHFLFVISIKNDIQSSPSTLGHSTTFTFVFFLNSEYVSYTNCQSISESFFLFALYSLYTSFLQDFSFETETRYILLKGNIDLPPH